MISYLKPKDRTTAGRRTADGGLESEAARGDVLDRLSRPGIRLTLTVATLFVIAFIGYALLWEEAPVVVLDSPTYMSLARDVSHLRLTQLHMRTPGFPLLLVATGSEYGPSRLLFYVSLLMHFSSVWILSYLLLLAGMSRRVIIAFILVALSPPYVEASAYVNAETLSEFTLVITFAASLLWIFSRKRTLLAIAAVAATYSAFVRPTFQLVMPVLAVCFVALGMVTGLRRTDIKRLLLPMAAAATVTIGSLGAYAFVNYTKFGYFDTSTLAPYALCLRTTSVIEYLPEEYSGLREILIRHRDRSLVQPFESHTGLEYIHRAIPDVRRFYGGDEVKMLNALRAANVYLIVHKPVSYVVDSLQQMVNYWMPNPCPLSTGQSAVLRSLWLAMQAVILGSFFMQAITVVGLGALAVSARLAKRSFPLCTYDRHMKSLVYIYVAGMGMILYTAVLSCFFSMGLPRYRVPTDTLIIMISVIGYAIWRRVLVGHPTAGEFDGHAEQSLDGETV